MVERPREKYILVQAYPTLPTCEGDDVGPREVFQEGPQHRLRIRPLKRAGETNRTQLVCPLLLDPLQQGKAEADPGIGLRFHPPHRQATGSEHPRGPPTTNPARPSATPRATRRHAFPCTPRNALQSLPGDSEGCAACAFAHGRLRGGAHLGEHGCGCGAQVFRISIVVHTRQRLELARRVAQGITVDILQRRELPRRRLLQCVLSGLLASRLPPQHVVRPRRWCMSVVPFRVWMRPLLMSYFCWLARLLPSVPACSFLLCAPRRLVHGLVQGADVFAERCSAFPCEVI